MLKRRILVGALLAGGLAGGAWAVRPRLAHSADHLDSPATQADPAADINDVYTWMDGNNAVFAMTVFPAATATSRFSDATQYAIHTASGAAFGTVNAPFDIIATFNAAGQISAWAGTSHYVTGDASQAAGLSSTDGRFKIFAGLRSDPFFFNLAGFRDTVATVKAAAGGLTFDTSGCPALDAPTSTLLVGKLSTTDGGTAVDFFRDLKTLAIVVSIDKALVTTGGPIVSAWASTHRKP